MLLNSIYPGFPHRRTSDLMQRIEDRIVRIPESGCWIWIDTLDRRGYARLSVWVKEKHLCNLKLAHRLSFSVHVRAVKPGSVLRHRCDVACCVNPHHLDEGTQAENLADMYAKGRDRGQSRKNRLKTHCNKGHPLSGANLRIEGKLQRRRCRTCEYQKKGYVWKQK